MFFRTKKTQTGQALQLQENYRNYASCPRSRLVVSLGNPDIPPQSLRTIAKAVEKKLYGRAELFPETLTALEKKWVDEIVHRIDREGKWRPISQKVEKETGEIIDGVYLDRVDHENDTLLGPVLIGWEFWKRLGMPDLLRRLGFSEIRAASAAMSVINRLVEPESEHALPEWIRQTSLPDIMEISDQGKDCFYRVSDDLLRARKPIEKHLRETTQNLFSLDRTILLYDLTNTHFEGLCESNPKAMRGKNKQMRDDCLQVVVGIVFDRNGFAVGHQVFEGNRHDSKTLAAMIDGLQDCCGNPDPFLSNTLLVMDAGLASEKNKRWLREQGISYLVNEARPGRQKYRDYFKDESAFTALPDRDPDETVLVRSIEDPESGDRIVLCRSILRKAKEAAIKSRAEARFLSDLEKLAHRIASGRLKIPAKIHRAIGRLERHHPRVARFYDIDLNTDGPLRLIWSRNDPKYCDDDDVLGGYVIRTCRKDLSPEEIWRIYVTLTQAEAGFKSLKSDLGLRPVYHQLESRVDAHVFITILGYQLLRSITYQLESQGDRRSWATIHRLLRSHCYSTLILPARNMTHRVRKAGVPDEQQKDIYAKLSVDWKQLPVSKIRVK